MPSLSNIGAERSVIGALVSDKRVQGQADRLSASDFTSSEYKQMFTAIQQMRLEKQSIDSFTLLDRLQGKLAEEIVDAMQATPSTVNCSAYVDLVLDASMRRHASDIGETLYKMMGDPTQDIQGAIATARAGLSDIGYSSSEWMTTADIGTRMFEDLEKRARGEIKPAFSGIPDLDYLTGGFMPGEFIIVGAKPGVGKSVFGMMVALNGQHTNKKSGICSLEMVDTQYGQRLVSNLSGVDGMKLRKAEGITPEDWTLIIGALGQLAKIPTAFNFALRYVEDLVMAVKSKKDKEGMDILVVDYLQLLDTRKQTESERLNVAYVSKALKNLAVDSRMPVIALAQLRRPGQGESNKMPNMRDLKESGNLEQDADTIILMHEPDQKEDAYVYKDDKPYFDSIKARGDRYIVLKVEKQRQGQLGVVSVIFNPKTMQYTQIRRGKA